MKTIYCYKLNENAKLPSRNYSTDCGLDLYSLEDVFIPLNSTKKVPTGCALRIEPGYVGKLEDRSGTASRGLKVGGGVIDPGYNGEVGVVLHNLTNNTDHDFFGKAGYLVKKGDRIAQLLVYKCEFPEVVEGNKLWDSERGNKGFNSSGK